MKIFDISRTLSADLPPWPGDVAFSYRLNETIAEGSSVNVGSINMSLHNGTHGDAMFHFADNGWTMEQAKLARYFGPAIVVDLAAKYAGGAMPQMTVDDLAVAGEGLGDAPRLLLKTNVWTESHIFPKQIPVVARGVPAWLKERGVKLLGLDVPSVDEITAKDLVNHHALGVADVNIIESLDLSAVEAGRYNFCALPLKIARADGSPVRAILWRD